MVTADFVNGKSIETNGLISGTCRRTKSEKYSNYVFKSESHPRYTLTFARAYSVAVENRAEGKGP